MGTANAVAGWQWFRPVLGVLLLALACSPALGVEPDEVLKDAALEARARTLSRELRCLVCQNQSIDDSGAPLARDLSVIVRERLTAGDSDATVLAFVEARYGEFVLLRPRLNAHTIILWLAPMALLAAVAIALWRRTRLRLPPGLAPRPPAPLSPGEQERLQKLLKAE
jgi:cytochrome c-type biogenesis protein CcmH